MCDTCGCGVPGTVSVTLNESALADNDHRAAHNREHFDHHGVTAINIMGSPGSGKTALLEATGRAAPAMHCAALSGDLATTRDADRLRAAGIRSRSITTGTACHLDARLVHDAMDDVLMHHTDHLFIENVGNLVCPALFDLGQHASVVVLSVTEGADKPLKYPPIFRRAQLVVVSKIDLLPHLDTTLDEIERAIEATMPEPRYIALSARTGEGMPQWLEWLASVRTSRPAGVTG
jgi:hydrogenase nickel incorporation protein HypB